MSKSGAIYLSDIGMVVDYMWFDFSLDDWAWEKRWSDRMIVEENLFQAWRKLLDKYARLKTAFFGEGALCDIVFREAVINLLVHQDYATSGRQAVLRWFKDRIVFRNPGGTFPGERGNENLEPGQKWERNPLIFRAFKDLGLIQSPGPGLRNIEENWVKLGFVKPVVTINRKDDTFELVLLKE